MTRGCVGAGVLSARRQKDSEPGEHLLSIRELAHSRPSWVANWGQGYLGLTLAMVTQLAVPTMMVLGSMLWQAR